MNKKEWKWFKKNSTKHIWKNAQAGWVKELFPTPFMDFLSHFKYGEKFYNNMQALRFLIKRKAAMPNLEYIVTTRCTLNCKHCNTFIPYFNNQTHANLTTFETFKKDIDKLLKSVDYIYDFGFVGGEPLLSKDLPKMIEYAVSKRQLKHIFIATNCTILPSSELIKVMKHKKVAVQISDYRQVKNIKGNVKVQYDEFKKILIDYGINFNNYQEKREAATWATMPELYIDNRDPKIVQAIYDTCYGRYCTMLCEGLITQCTLAVYVSRCMELTQGVKDELVNIRELDTKELTQRMIKYYARPFSQFCHYCHIENRKINLPCGEQMD